MATEVLVLGGSSGLEQKLISSAGSLVTSTRARVDFGGVLVDRLDLYGAVEQVRTFLRGNRAHQIVTVNLDFLSIARRDSAFRTTLNASDLAVADGMPLVWLSRVKSEPLPERVAGVELFTECCALAAEEERGVFLLGAAPGVAEKAGVTLQQRYPNLKIVGTYSPPNGPLSRRENERIVRMVRRAAPDFLFVALGAPRQDVWIRNHMPRLNVRVSMGVGCVFDLLAGEVTRAPSWMRRAGLEWAFRLSQEPTRLWRRYLLHDLPTLGHLLLAGFGHGRDSSTSVAVPT